MSPLGLFIVLANSSIRSGDIPIIDSKGKVFGLIVAKPKGWDEQHRLISEAMKELEQDLKGLGCPPNRRGEFAAYAKGFILGGGPEVRK